MIFMNNDEYHIQYDFAHLILLSYLLWVSRPADPISGCSGSPDYCCVVLAKMPEMEAGE